MSKSSARATDSSCATYKGILVKTLYFLAATVAGFALFLLNLSNACIWSSYS